MTSKAKGEMGVLAFLDGTYFARPESAWSRSWNRVDVFSLDSGSRPLKIFDSTAVLMSECEAFCDAYNKTSTKLFFSEAHRTIDQSSYLDNTMI